MTWVGPHLTRPPWPPSPAKSPSWTTRWTWSCPHLIVYTSGTTGKPKGAVLSQSNCLWNALNLHVDLEFTSRGPSAGGAAHVPHRRHRPVHPGHALRGGHGGGAQRSFDPAQIMRRLVARGASPCSSGCPPCTCCSCSRPTSSPPPLSRVRMMLQRRGSPAPGPDRPVPGQLGITLQQGYGMSEASPSTTVLLPQQWASDQKRLGGSGPFSCAAQGGRARWPRSCHWARWERYCLRAPTSCKVIGTRPEANQEAFTQGWFHTGDLGRLDADGFLYMVDRQKDMYISGGENVYPAEVEHAIFELEGVAEAAVVGMPDSALGRGGQGLCGPPPGGGAWARTRCWPIWPDAWPSSSCPAQVVFVQIRCPAPPRAR